MLRFFTGIVIVISLVSLQARGDTGSILNAIRQVESGSNPKVKDGDGGKAIGQYQIHYAYWKDSGIPGKYEDCRNEAYARKVVIAYWKRYAPTALANNDYETLARIHNGGPAGAKIAATNGYWKKVKNELSRQKSPD